jgi:dihydrofolate synthase/folylpolyglutamate synthase
MKFETACAFLAHHANYEKKTRYEYTASFSLERVKKLLAALGDPQCSYASILIAGTNGKGSTAAVCARLAQEHGVRTGLYTSPHLVDLRERIQIDGEYISKQAFASRMARIKHALTRTRLTRRITYFEILTVLAFLYFADRKIDLCVAEVGLGGRLDATNVLPAGISVLTPIDYDHQILLGRTLAKIAREKAGIIHPQSIVISAVQPQEAAAVIVKYACRQQATLYTHKKDFRLSNMTTSGGRIRFDFGHVKNIALRLAGPFQADNAAVALQAFYMYAARHGIRPQAGCVRNAFKRVIWPGRFEILRRRPRIILDGAHNPHAIRGLVRSIKKLYPRDKKVIIYATARDKDFRQNLKLLRSLTRTIVLTSYDSPRCLDLASLKRHAGRFFKDIHAFSDIQQALACAGSIAGKEGTIVITGSLYLVGEFKKKKL